MKTKILSIVLLIFSLQFIASAKMLLFTKEDCTFCQELKTEIMSYDNIEEYEISHNLENLNLYVEKSKELNYKNGGVPLLIDGSTYVEGKDPILKYLSSSQEEITTPKKTVLSTEDLKNLNNIIKREEKKQPGILNKPNNKYYISIATILLIALSFIFFKLKRRT